MSSQPFTQTLVESKGKAPVVISLFGAFEFSVNGAVVTGFRSNKTRALLAYLLLTRPQRVLRTTLIDLLWPGYTDKSAQSNLRQTLLNLRNLLAPFGLLKSDRKYVQLYNDSALLWCDAQRFTTLLDACHQHEHRSLAACPRCRSQIQVAVALYQGALLENFPATDSEPFNRWLQSQRAHFAEAFTEAQTTLTTAGRPAGNLPSPLTTLVGRTVELTNLVRKMGHTTYRCVSLVGPGGIGKTRLAVALGTEMQPNFPDGVWVVELSGLAPSTPDEPTEQLHDRLAAAMASAIGLTFYGTTRPTEQVAKHLADKGALLILDSFEHLVAGAAWLPSLLTTSPRLRLLITTRHRLPLHSQLVYHVEGLGVPPAAAVNGFPAHLVAQYAGVQLFVERAESAGLTLALDGETLAAVGRLCHLVEGSPWAIEVAAAMLDQHTPAALLAAIQGNYRTLTTNLLDVPARQRSAEALFLTVWSLLTAEEAQTLARCAVFRGGFTLDAAQRVAATTPATLEALVQKSLLHPGAADRYTMHDLVRQFAEEQLGRDAASAQQSRTAHAIYFTALLATWQPDDATLLRFRTAVTQDWENVQAAWAWAVESGQVTLLQQGVGGLAEFYNLVELYLEADAILGRAIDQVRLLLDAAHAAGATAADHRVLQTLLAHLLWRQCYFVNGALTETERAAPLAQELLTLAHDLDDGALRTRAYYQLSIVAYFQSDSQRQEQLLLQALSLAQHHGTIYDQIVCLNLLGAGRARQMDVAAALEHFHQALALTQHGHYAFYDLMVLNNIGSLQVSTGDFTAAMTTFQRARQSALTVAFKIRLAFITASLGEIAYLVGDYATACAQLTEAYQHYVEIRDYVIEPQILNILGALSAELGDDTAALDHCQRALASTGGHLYVVQHSALCTLGHLHRRQEQWDAAAARYQQALALSQAVHQVTDELLSQTYLAAIALAQGDATSALVTVEPLLAHFATSFFTPQQRPQELLLIAYQILIANGDPRALAVLQQAWALVQKQLAQIDDPRLRHTFLTNVPVNRVLARLVE